jgi:hypothetical protein
MSNVLNIDESKLGCGTCAFFHKNNAQDKTQQDQNGEQKRREAEPSE